MKTQNCSISLMCALGIIVSCQKAESTLPLPPKDSIPATMDSVFFTTDEQTILGDTIDIPYSIENLVKAYAGLPTETKSQINLEYIQPTHYYVRFYPKSIEELDILRNIKPHIFLSEIPLDRKILVGGSSYHDPSLPMNLPTFQYTVVPADYWLELKESVPVESEILIQAYIPDYNDEYNTKSEAEYGIPAKAYEALLKEAYRITGNEYDVIPKTKSSWTPSGRIRAYDDGVNSYVPIKGVRVRGTHLLKVKEALTDANGCFTLASFSNPVNLSIIWESDDWDVRDGLVGQARFDGPQLNGQYWYCDIGTEHEKNIRFAAMHRAAYRYYYGYIEGLFRPLAIRKEKLCYIDDYNLSASGCNMSNMGLGVLPDMCVYGKKSTSYYKETYEVFKSTAHEFAHLAHCLALGQIDYWGTDLIVKESWCEFAELVLTTLEYSALGVSDLSSIVTTRQDWKSTWNEEKIKYSPFFIDFCDTYNQGANDSTYPNDEISGFTSSIISQILLLSSTLYDAKELLKTYKPANITNTQIESYFSYYENL